MGTIERVGKRYQRYSKEYRAKVMAQLIECKNVTALAQELGMDREVLYKWRQRMEGRASQRQSGVESSQRRQNEVIDELKRLLAEKTLEVDFFKGALQKIAARRQNNSGSGEKASMRKSES